MHSQFFGKDNSKTAKSFFLLLPLFVFILAKNAFWSSHILGDEVIRVGHFGGLLPL
jgi:hypothetical protein